MKWNRLLSMLTVSALAAGALAGCGGSGASKNGESGQPNTSAEKVTLTMWGGVPIESGPQEVIDNWNKANPNIQVKYERYVNDDSGNLKLDTALMTGSDIDLFVSYSVGNLKKRVDSKSALDLSEFKDYNIDQKIGERAKDWMIGGKHYGIPTSKSNYFVALNKDLLDKAGLPIPTDWTWDDAKMYAEKLKDEKRYGFIQHLEPFADTMDATLKKEGYTKADGSSNLDHPEITKWMEVLNSMMKDGKTSVPLGEQLTNKMPVDVVFLKGEAAMLNIGTWLLRSSNDLKTNPRTFKIAFAPVPKISKDKDYPQRGGLGDLISINAQSKHKEAAWKFLKWYADGGMMPMAKGGRIPASNAASADEAVQMALSGVEQLYDMDSLKRVLFTQKPTFTRDVAPQVMDLRREEYEKFFLGNQDMKTTQSNMVKRHNEYLKQSNKK